jgi:outer membrane protein assembly factor BamE (lipoprotein component of BamABCDE complex)
LHSLVPRTICDQTRNQPVLKTIKHRAVAMPLKKIFFFAALLLAVSGCDTIDHRISEKQDVFNRLDPKAQAVIRQGRVEIGYTPEMVYIALGKPDKIDGNTWYYKLYFEEGDGPLYVKRYEEDFTIPFADGKVTDGLRVTLNGVRVQ